MLLGLLLTGRKLLRVKRTCFNCTILIIIWPTVAMCSYCECFAAGVYCSEPCSCQGCMNKPIHEETVLSTRKQIEFRNPLAFAPKVIRMSDAGLETGVRRCVLLLEIEMYVCWSGHYSQSVVLKFFNEIAGRS
jgi:hypothetical protein